MKPAAAAVQTRHLWYNLTTDHQTGHYVGKDVFKVVSMLAALAYTAAIVWVKVQTGHDLPTEPLAFYIVGAGIFQGAKFLDTYFNRKTYDGSGNPLTASEQQTIPPTNQPADPNAPQPQESGSYRQPAP